MTRDDMTRDLKRLSYYANCIHLLCKSQITNEYISSISNSNRQRLSYINHNLEECINNYANILQKYIKYILEMDDPVYQSLLLGKYVVGVRKSELLKHNRMDAEYLQGELKKARKRLYQMMQKDNVT